MKKTNILSLVLMGLAVTSIGCAGGGHSSLPKIISVSPAEGSPSDTVELQLDRFNWKKDIILFGGVPVKATVVAPTETASDTLSTPGSKTLKSLSLVPTSKSSTQSYLAGEKVNWTIRVPGVDPGNVEITIRRGDRETDPVSFTVLGTTGSDGKEDVVPTDPTNIAGNDDEVITPTAGDTTTPAGDGYEAGTGTDAGTDTGTDTTTPPDDSHPDSVVSLSHSFVSGLNGLNYVKVQWSLAYVDSAFIRVPINYINSDGVIYPDPISFDQFQGNLSNPFPFSPLASEEELLDKLFSTPMNNVAGDMPFNYCYIPQQGSGYKTDDDCYSVNPNNTSFNYIDIMVPLTPDQKFNNGTWKFLLPASRLNVFAVYYRDWKNNLEKKTLTVNNPF